MHLHLELGVELAKSLLDLLIELLLTALSHGLKLLLLALPIGFLPGCNQLSVHVLNLFSETIIGRLIS